MTELLSLALNIQDVCKKNGWPFCIIGGLALQHWGEPRLTRDVDATVLTGFGGEEPIVDALLEQYKPRIADAREFALLNRVLLLQSENGIGIDIALGALPFEQRAIDRAVEVEVLSEKFLRLCTAEDLIVMKAFADRPRDWFDIESILMRQDRLDWNYIMENLKPLCEAKEDPDIVPRLEAMRRKS